MNTSQIATLARQLLAQYGLDRQGWTFAWDNGKRRAGACHYRTRTISASKYILPTASDEEVRETLLHEIAHALTPGHSHDAVWAAKLREMGGTGARTHSMETVEGRYDLTCSNCGVIGNRHQKQGHWKYASATASPYRHRVCGGILWLQDRVAAAPAVQVPVAASEARETPKEGPVCAHGCGMTTKGGRYLPGHDAKHVANLAADIAVGTRTPKDALAEIGLPHGSAALHNKLVARLHKMGWTYNDSTLTWSR
uniref:SprT-like protease n=1 Tax=Micrococcus phage Olihed TaxID=3092209 RepID=A0AAU6R709_9CAUD